jgi:hypothetical protein
LYRVDWEDAVSDGGWTPLVKARDPKLIVVHSVGYLVNENRKAIVLAQQVSSSSNFADTITIPKSCIIKKVKLPHKVEFLNG